MSDGALLFDTKLDTTGLTAGLGNGLKAAGAAVAATTGAMVAFGKSAVDAGMNFDSSMSQVAATMGVTVDEIDGLRNFAQEMGATTVFSATQAADALNYMALAGYDANTSMEMLPNVLNLAAAGGIDLAYASDMITDSQTALGLSIDETTALVDKMAKASSTTNTSVSQLGEAILTIGGTAKNLAGGTTELSQVLGLLADNGIKGAEAGTHLRNIMLSLMAPTDKAALAIDGLGISVVDAQDNMLPMQDIMQQFNDVMADMGSAEKTELINKIFNKTDIASVNALLATTTERWDAVGLAIEGAWYTSESLTAAFEEIGYMPSILDEMQKNLESVGVTQEEFSEALDRSGGNVERFYENLADLSNEAATWEDIENALIIDSDELGMAFEKATGAAQKMADTQLDNLEGDITLFKSALEGAQIAVSDQLTPTLRDFVQFGSDGLSQLTESFKKDGLTGALETFGDVLSDGLTMLISKTPDIVSAAIKLLETFGQGIMSNAPILIDAVVQILTMFGKFILQNLPLLIESGMQIILMLAQGIAAALPELIPQIVDIVIQIALTLVENLPLLYEAGLQIFLGIIVGLVQALPQIIAALPQLIDGIISALIDCIPLFADCGVQLLLALIMNLPAIIAELVKAAPQIVQSLIRAFSQLKSQFAATGKDFMMQLKDGITGMLSNLVAEAKNIGSNIVDGIKSGISAGWSALTSYVGNLATELFNAAKSALGISSPSKKFRWLAEMCVAGFDDGLEGLMDGSSLRSSIDATLGAVSAKVYGGSAVAGTSQTFNFYDTQTSPDAIRRKFDNTMTFGLAGGI